MIYALVADIHSNIEALDAVIEHAREHGADRFVFLGDLVGYGADPVAVIECVQQLVQEGAVALMGNHDASVIGRESGFMHEEPMAAILWTQRQLQTEHFDFLAALPLILREDGMTFVHASAQSPEEWTYVVDAREARESLNAAKTSYVFSGHVHDPILYYIGRDARMTDFKPTEGVVIPVTTTRNWLAIPGSAGQPRDGKTGARYALFDRTHERLTFYRIAYDFALAATKIRAAGLPERFAKQLEGRA